MVWFSKALSSKPCERINWRFCLRIVRVSCRARLSEVSVFNDFSIVTKLINQNTRKS